MTKNILEIESREQRGKGAARRLRRQGLIPAVMYGHKGNRTVAVHYKEFKKLFEESGEHAIITLSLGEIILEIIEPETAFKASPVTDFDSNLLVGIVKKTEETDVAISRNSHIGVFHHPVNGALGQDGRG